jgi:hypothetical protein
MTICFPCLCNVLKLSIMYSKLHGAPTMSLQTISSHTYPAREERRGIAVVAQSNYDSKVHNGHTKSDAP